MTAVLLAALMITNSQGRKNVNDVIVSLEKPALKDGELRLPYTVANNGAGPVFLLNLYEDIFKILKPRPRTKWSADLAPTCYIANEGTMVVWAGAVPRPARPGVSFFAPYTPLASRLAPGETFRAVLRFPLPILEWGPYDAPSSEKKVTDPVQVTKVRVIVDVVREADARVKEPSREQPGAFQAVGDPTHHLAAEGELASIILLRRTDGFRRMIPVEPPPFPFPPGPP